MAGEGWFASSAAVARIGFDRWVLLWHAKIPGYQGYWGYREQKLSISAAFALLTR
jgi:hypothetical protein